MDSLSKRYVEAAKNSETISEEIDNVRRLLIHEDLNHSFCYWALTVVSGCVDREAWHESVRLELMRNLTKKEYGRKA